MKLLKQINCLYLLGNLNYLKVCQKWHKFILGIILSNRLCYCWESKVLLFLHLIAKLQISQIIKTPKLPMQFVIILYLFLKTLNYISAQPVIINDITTSEIILERGDLSAGIYFIELRGSRILRHKIIIE